jgi:hypothetical protein
MHLNFVRVQNSPPISRLRISPIAGMFHDLSVPWGKDRAELQRTVAFLDERK